jgi:hypothetical protein
MPKISFGFQDVLQRAPATALPSLRHWLTIGAVVLASMFVLVGQGIATSHSSDTGAHLHQQHQRWIQDVTQRRTADGATVAEVLAYVESQRPMQFKVADIDVRYSGVQGEPQAVVIGYWIGSNRKPNDSYVDLSYPLSRSGDVQAVPRSAITLRALEAGRASFLQQVDAIYAMACKPFPESVPRC